MVQLLLDAGVSVHSPPSKEHSSVLQATIDREAFGFVDRFIELGVNVNAHDPRFGTALSTAARKGSIDLVKKLVEKGADYTLAGERFGQVPPSPVQAC
jgi:ankyrin repeat protein